MTDAAVVHMGENSPEHIAYQLFRHVAFAEKKAVGGGAVQSNVDRKYILDTYAECLNTVRNPHNRDHSSS
jgi:hypothetical protein